jgi:transposase-like protein
MIWGEGHASGLLLWFWIDFCCFFERNLPVPGELPGFNLHRSVRVPSGIILALPQDVSGSRRRTPQTTGTASAVTAKARITERAPRHYRPPAFPAPVLRLPAGPFRPPHCPNKECTYYQPQPGWRYVRHGTYRAPACRRPLPRFRCLPCGRTFSPRTFAATYWLHRYHLFALILRSAVAGSGLRQIARTLGISHATVARHLTRGGRQCLVFHRQMVMDKQVREPLVIDGFETFEFSQFFPCHYNLAVGRNSWFLYHFTDSPLRRKGRMTAAQKQKREELETNLDRPDPKAVENGIFELLRTVWWELSAWPKNGVTPTSARPSSPAATGMRPVQGRIYRLHSDEHPAYLRSLRRLRRLTNLRGVRPSADRSPEQGAGDREEAPGSPGLIHQTTPSTAARTCGNDLFPVNLADLLIRHSSAGHHRETISFDKRRQCGLERLALFAVWRNAIKWRRENKPGETAAMRAGMATRRLDWEDVLAQRRFPRRTELPGPWWDYYWRQVKTSALGETQTANRARFAF